MRYLLYRRKSRYIFFYQKYRLLLWRTINIYTCERLCFHKKGLYCRLKVKIIVSSFYWKKWWEEMDSNHRSETQRIYSPPLLATQEPSHKNGWGGRIRTAEMQESKSCALPLGYTPILQDP